MLLRRQNWTLRIRQLPAAFLLLLCMQFGVSGAQQPAEFPAQAAPAVFDFDQARPAFAELDGLWRFHTGDDPDGKLGWADPNFDDSSWPLLSSDRNWSDQGYQQYGGFAWYRFKVVMHGNHRQLALVIPQLLTSYQVFAGGQLIGQFGGLPPHAKVLLGVNQIFSIPAGIVSAAPARSGLAQSGQVLSFAIRVWHFPWLASSSGGGSWQAPYIGELALGENWKTHRNNRSFWQTSSANILMLINLLAAITGLALFAARPAEREYLWFGIYELLTGVQHLVENCRLYYPIPWHAYRLLGAVISETSWLFFLFFLFRLLSGRRNWLYWTGIATVIFQFLFLVVAELSWIQRATWSLASSLTLVPYFVCILALLYQAARRGVPDARLLLLPVAVCYGSWFTLNLLGIFYTTGHSWILQYFAKFFELTSWPFPISVQDIADMLMLLSIVAILPLRFARTRRDEQRLATEMKSAQQVQAQLVPSSLPHLEHLRVEAAFMPAAEVGGDFYQIIPQDDESVLIVLGDVSGKGLKAAMKGTWAIGAIRVLAAEGLGPAELLSRLNRELVRGSDGGFITCMCAHFSVDGVTAFANAGHLSPYVNGREMECDSGLPLGIAENKYTETVVVLAPGDRVTLLSDGVVEARNARGELFGFDRTAAVSTQPAQAIAQAAQAHGQEDDITVLTLARA